MARARRHRTLRKVFPRGMGWEKKKKKNLARAAFRQPPAFFNIRPYKHLWHPRLGAALLQDPEKHITSHVSYKNNTTNCYPNKITR